jgi:nucleotide-binding universal stress UspA family protein
MPSPVLVGLDPDHQDDAPLTVGRALAELTGAPLMVAGTFLHDPITNAVSTGTVDADRRAEVLRELEARTAGVDADLLVKGGPSPARTLHEAAVELDASLLVVGSTRRGALGRVVPGSTAERLLQGSPCPVVVTPAGLPDGWAPRRIGAGFLDAEDGRAGLRAAAALAHAAGAPLRAVTAVEPIDWSRHPAVAPLGADDLEAWRASAQATLDAELAALAADATGEVVMGSPIDALAELSEEVDVLVCGSRGYGPIRAVLLGGVTRAVVRMARCPVLIVPRTAEPAPAEAPDRSGTAAS